MKALRFVIGLWFITLVFTLVACSNTSRPEPSQIPSTKQPTVTGSPPVAAAPKPAPAPMVKPTPLPHRLPSIIDVPGSGHAHEAIRLPRPNVYVPYKSVLTPSDEILSEPYSFIYFNKPPTTTRLKAQYQAICEMYVETFVDKQSAIKYMDPKSEALIPVFWLTKKSSDEKPCDVLVKDYDYQRARYIVKGFNRNYDSPNLIAKFDEFIVRMNLAGLEKQEDIDLAFSVWREHIASYPNREKDLTIVSVVFSARKVLGAFATILTFSKV